MWTVLGLARLYSLPLLVLVFKYILHMKKVTCAVFRLSGKKKVPFPQACFQLLLCLCKAGRLNYFWRLPKLCVRSLVAGDTGHVASPFCSCTRSNFGFALGVDLIRTVTWIVRKAVKFQVV